MKSKRLFVLTVLLLLIGVYIYFNSLLVPIRDKTHALAIDDALAGNETISAILDFYNTVKLRERRVFSQNLEDGVIETLFQLLNITDLKKYFVEIGTETGVQCNTRYIRERLHWTGIMFDGLYSNMTINLFKESIHYSTVLKLFEKYKIPADIDLLSEDTDYADYWIVEEILRKYRPKVLIHEINQQTPDKCVTVPKTEEKIHYWDGTIYHGASLCAFYCLAKQNDYSMVYCEIAGINCFWIRNDLIRENLKLNPIQLQHVLNPTFLYRPPHFKFTESNKPWYHIQC